MAPTLKDKLWNDGEEITYGDLNNMQRFARSCLNDAVLGSLCWSANQWEHGTFPDAATVYALRGGGMLYYFGGGGISMALNPGLIAIAQAGDWWSAGTGDDANLRFAYLTSGTFTFSANSSGNPRYDLLQVQITQADGDDDTRHFEDAVSGAVTSQGGGVGTPPNVYRERTYAATVSVKAGTPAGSPTVPTPDAGYVALAAVLLNNGYAGGTARPNGLIDYRVPMGATVETVVGHNWARSGTWANSGVGIIAPASSQTAYAVPPAAGSHHKRLMKVGFARQKLASSTGAVALVRLDHSGGGASLLTLTASLMVTGGLAYEEYSLVGSAPIWANGYTGRDNAAGLLSTADSAGNVVALEFTSDGTRQDAILWARFFFAGGF